MTNASEGDFQRVLENVQRRVRSKQQSGIQIECSITRKELFEQWMKQEGICTRCGIEIDVNGPKHIDGQANLMGESVDRIDHRGGYVKENIQFQHFVCNAFKSQFSKEVSYAIARRICEQFETSCPQVVVEVAKKLKEAVDGKKHVDLKLVLLPEGGLELGGSANAQNNPNFDADDK